MTIMNDADFRLTRTAVTARFPRPFITVVSAKADDCRAFVADGLASSFAHAGLRTALIVSDTTILQPSSLIAKSGNGKVELFTITETALQDVAAFIAAVHAVRERFDAVVMVGSATLESEAMLQAALIADGVIAAVQTGRAADQADRNLIDALRLSGVALFGVIPAAAEVQGHIIAAHTKRMATITADVSQHPVKAS